MMYTTRPILSYTRKEYAPVNAEVNVIRSDGIVAIVETAAGNRFPCLVEALSDEMVVVEEEDENISQLRKPKSNDKDQLNLFGL